MQNRPTNELGLSSSEFATAKSYLFSFLRYTGKKAWISLSMMVLLGLSEGVGLIMLIPLLQLLGSLDTETEQRIQDAIEGLHGELTMVIISHRLSTIRRADHIVVLDRGQVVEAGAWKWLTQKKDGRFRELLEQQH